MVKPISQNFKQHLSQASTTVTLLWKITRTDRQILGFTSHDNDIINEGITYQASTAFDSTALDSTVGMRVDNLTIESVFTSGSITESDMQSGLYDDARVDIYLINFKSPNDGALHLFRGFFGEVKVSDLGFMVEILGLGSKLDVPLGKFFSPLCRVNLGSKACTINLSSFTYSGVVTSVISNKKFSDASNTAKEDNYYRYGLLTFKSGFNLGKSYEVKSFTQSSGEIELYLPADFNVAVGDTYEVYAGCDKRFITCKNKFQNQKNFQGEPHVPGQDFLISVVT